MGPCQHFQSIPLLFHRTLYFSQTKLFAIPSPLTCSSDFSSVNVLPYEAYFIISSIDRNVFAIKVWILLIFDFQSQRGTKWLKVSGGLEII